jgi:hypothetical protein
VTRRRSQRIHTNVAGRRPVCHRPPDPEGAATVPGDMSRLSGHAYRTCPLLAVNVHLCKQVDEWPWLSLQGGAQAPASNISGDSSGSSSSDSATPDASSGGSSNQAPLKAPLKAPPKQVGDPTAATVTCTSTCMLAG